MAVLSLLEIQTKRALIALPWSRILSILVIR
jgi:hypothetical protein